MKNAYIFFCILLFLILAVPGLMNRAVWFDELASIQVATQDFPQLLNMTAHDTHPPLFFLLLKIWSQFSMNLQFLRIFSLVMGIGNLILMGKLSQKILPKKAAMIATVLFSISPFHVYYATEIRMYVLFIFETLILTLFLLKFIKETSVKHALFILSISLAILYTHYYAGLIILALSFWLWFNHESVFKQWLFIQLIACLLFIPWLLYAGQFSKPGCWCFSPLIGLPILLSAFAVGSVGIVTHKDILTFASIPVILLFICTSFVLFGLFLKGLFKRTSISSPLYYLIFLPLSIIIPISLFTFSFSPRAFIFLLPFYLMVISHGVISLKSYSRKVLLCVVILLTLTSMIQSQDVFFLQIPPLKKNLDIYNLKIFNP